MLFPVGTRLGSTPAGAKDIHVMSFTALDGCLGETPVDRATRVKSFRGIRA
jgi:hypothetical protein